MSKTEVISFEAELAALASEQAAQVATGSGFKYISTAQGKLSIAGTPIDGNALDVVIVAAPNDYTYYAGRYDPTKPASPVCFAINNTANDMKPSPLSTEPQATECSKCANNEWGSAGNGGQGKKCKQTKRLFLISATSLNDADTVTSADVAVLRTPVTSNKEYATYVQKIAAMLKVPVAAVITKVSIVPDPKSQFKLKFDYVGKIENMEVVKALIGRGKELIDQAVQSNHSESETSGDKTETEAF